MPLGKRMNNTVKIMMLTAISLLIVIVACKKEKECDKTDPNSECYVPPVVNNPTDTIPAETELEKLIKDSTNQAQTVRDGFYPAKYVPLNISDAFDARFEVAGVSSNIVDSSNNVRTGIDILWADYGHGYNEETVSKLYEDAGIFLVTVAKLEKLRQK